MKILCEWYERYAADIVYPLIHFFPEDVDTVFNDIEIVFDACGLLKGVKVRGRFIPLAFH